MKFFFRIATSLLLFFDLNIENHEVPLNGDLPQYIDSQPSTQGGF